tara:strand:+ start:1570 stop:1902 length:333 start_codon:yes stop_codon:yes gene_type:complete
MNKITEIYQAIRWWERKRLIYNAFPLLGGLLVPLLRSDVPNGISTLSPFLIILFFLFGANILYTFGWASEVLLNYYFKLPFWGKGLRRVLFVLGCLFSFYWMFVVSRPIP